METVYIALGSNLDDPLEQIKQAVGKLKKFAIRLESSPLRLQTDWTARSTQLCKCSSEI